MQIIQIDSTAFKEIRSIEKPFSYFIFIKPIIVIIHLKS